MKSLYHVAIIEGYLSQNGDLPTPVREALDHLKQLTAPAPELERTPKKRRYSKEWRVRNLAQLAKMRETRRLNLAAKKAAKAA